MNICTFKHGLKTRLSWRAEKKTTEVEVVREQKVGLGIYFTFNM